VLGLILYSVIVTLCLVLYVGLNAVSQRTGELPLMDQAAKEGEWSLQDREKRTDIKSVTVLFENGDELTTDQVSGFIRSEVNDSRLGEYRGSWKEWTIRWSERLPSQME
jgi:hypothetical protein